MSLIFDKLVEHTRELKEILESRSLLIDEENPFAWENKVYTSASIRRAHLDVVDARDTKKLYMLHVCIFPKVYDSAPIYGFDLIAGPNKVTGAFLDYSPTSDKDHPMIEWFAEQVKDYDWSKPRQLPDWAKEIFSPSMVAAGNINTEWELNEILDLSKRALLHYLRSVHELQSKDLYDNKVTKYDFSEQQNKYCRNQKQNPHTPRVLQSLGFSEEDTKQFIQDCLFPEIK